MIEDAGRDAILMRRFAEEEEKKMDAALGTRDKQELQRMMQLVTQLMKVAKEKGASLDPGEEKELLTLITRVHAMLYPDQYRGRNIP